MKNLILLAVLLCRAVCFSQNINGLPPGLSLDQTTGHIVGTISATAAPGVYAYPVTICDTEPTPQCATPTPIILIPIVQIFPPVTVSNPKLPQGFPGKPYDQAIPVQGGNGSYTFKPATGPTPGPIN